MQIGDLARRSGIAASRIRFYERHAVLPKPERGANGYREYAETHIKMLGLIKGAQQLGFSLSEIREGLLQFAPDFPTHASMALALRTKLDTIDQHMKDVRARRRQIVKLIAELESD